MIKSLAEQVYDHVVQMIRDEELKFGDKVGEIFLVERLGISRTPIREALIQLASDNILENIPRKGFYVKGIDQEEFVNVYKIVCLLDVHALELAWDKLTEKDIEKMEDCIDKMDLALGLKSYETYEQWQEEFHEVYRDASGNPEINSTIEYLLKKIISSSFFLGDEDKLFEVSRGYNTEHKNILAAIKNKDIDTAKALLGAHWVDSEINVKVSK